MHRKLFDLARANAGKGAGLRSEVAGDTATIYVYDIIDSYWGCSASDMATSLQAITAPNLTLRINSPGGDVFEARAMMALLAEFPGTITAKIDGLAASAASFLMLAASSIEIAEGGFIMIHNGWTFTMGNAAELRQTAALLDKVDQSIIANYVAVTGKTTEQVTAWMAAETWFDADDAVANGFAGKVLPTVAASKAKALAFDLAAYANAPKALTEPEQLPDWDAETARRSARARLYERSAA